MENSLCEFGIRHPWKICRHVYFN